MESPIIIYNIEEVEDLLDEDIENTSLQIANISSLGIKAINFKDGSLEFNDFEHFAVCSDINTAFLFNGNYICKIENKDKEILFIYEDADLNIYIYDYEI